MASYYVDVEFTYCDCGRDEVWTANQQKSYYEVAKGSLFATAIRCRDCRNKLRGPLDGGGDIILLEKVAGKWQIIYDGATRGWIS